MNEPSSQSATIAITVIVFVVCLALPILLTFIFATSQRGVKRRIKKIIGLRTRRRCPKHAAEMKSGMCVLDSQNCDICRK